MNSAKTTLGRGWILAIVLLTAIAYFPLVFMHSEWTRKRLLNSYQAAEDFTRTLRIPGSSNVEKLLKPREVLVCVIDAYGSPESLKELNQAQRQALSKEHLPSEDMTWYMIFYSRERAERVVLFDLYGDSGLRLVNAGCFDRTGTYIVARGKKSSSEITIEFLRDSRK